MQFLSDGELMHRFEYVCDEPGGTKNKPKGILDVPLEIRING